EGPPKEEEFLDRSKGIEITTNKETVHPDEEGMWRYRLRVEPSGDFGVTIKKMTIKAYLYDGRYLAVGTYQEDDFKEWWGSSYIKLGESKSFGSGLPSKNDIHFRDHIFTGVNDAGEEVLGTIRVHFSKEKKEASTEETSLWEKKWSQQPDPKNTLHRVDNPEGYDVQGLRVNADFEVDLSEWFEGLKPKTYWVPATSLGTPDNTKDEILSLKGKPERAQREIDVLFEALSFIHLATEPGIHNAKTEGQKGIRWGFPKPAKPAIRDGTVNCASAANIIRYLLEDDYEEVGYVWRYSSLDSDNVGGHCTSYIKHQGKYYFFDPGSLAEERSKYPVEDGDGRGYHVDRVDYLIQSTPENYVIYWSQVSTNDEAIFAMFQCEQNHFALGNKEGKLYYPMAYDPANLTVWKDPQDSVELVQANYSPTPPKDQYGVKDYSDYMPFEDYLKPWTWSVEEQGEAQVLEMKSDG
ncbi:hypothetical protein KGY79_11350, partial [Candidatus Bipolaricaulota bacterium]|nr:hypothetical protein [Candidatus Bipolaricaulota bacterium]